ncbi:MAG: phage major capsid protein, partial [Actinomycetota bacterium]|nr:phage major capsid protein [Actinomycetota bacterium]
MRELRAKAHDSAKALMKAADDENRALTDDEQTAFDGYIAEAEKLDKQITSRESLDTMAAKIDKPDTRVAGSEAFSGDADSQDTDGGGEPEMRVLPQFEEDYRRDQQQQQRLYLPARVRSRGRLQAFTGERADENAFVFGHWLLGAISPHEPRRHFSQALCRDLGLSFELRAQTEGVNTAGGYLVPSQFENVIIRVVEQFGLARRECKILPMSSDKIDQPKGTGEATVTFVGETTDYTETNLTYGLVEYVAKKLTALTYVSNEIQEDALIPIID